MGMLGMSENIRTRKADKKEKRYAEFERKISEVETNRNYKTEEDLLQEDKNKMIRKIHLYPVLFSVFYAMIGAAFLTLGICMALKVLGNLLWLGILFLILSLGIFISLYPIQKRIQEHFYAKYGPVLYPASNEEEEYEDAAKVLEDINQE